VLARPRLPPSNLRRIVPVLEVDPRWTSLCPENGVSYLREAGDPSAASGQGSSWCKSPVNRKNGCTIARGRGMATEDRLACSSNCCNRWARAKECFKRPSTLLVY